MIGREATVEAVREIVARISFKDWRIEATRPEPSATAIQICIWAPVDDRDTGAPTSILGRIYLHLMMLQMIPTPDMIRLVERTVCHELQSLWRHEFDEHLLVNGVRVRDPHEERPDAG